ncbi:Zn(II)2Cys6 transcription factor domain-containing protein [Aspergillus luchuensis]|uniref:Uncharacterized protein n=1 Tax=Aspergillus kawachii TaxID=1069201 RepID=A0A7R7WBK7_ASPKA|nr:uncharacterized protein AKAW2_50041A [Aspergillus luchuensis]BCR99699.1 hypothetical protein AKAW2_50041A [Aspergillus luchuensis]BCS11991.1 hypothetical protein ALUC_50037A [Aspergillus luchuensis]
MVGVPGQYGGCATCRRRKKGCDRKTPFCTQCVQARLVCEGYSRNYSVWVNSTDGENRKYTKCTGRVQSCRRGAPEITLHESLARSTREVTYVGLYLAAFLPNGRLFTKEAAQISSAGWLRHLDKLCRSEKTLRFITLAHGLSMLATRDNDSQLKFKGIQAHSIALQEMRTALRDPQRASGDGILAAIRLFRFYEILYGAESRGSDKENPTLQIKGYYAHTDGEMALFMNRGWQKDWSEAGMYLLVSGRIVSFILGVGRRKRSPFSDNNWMSAPWKYRTKSLLDGLTDILVQVPGLLEELDTIRASPIAERSLRGWENLLGECIRIEQMLLAWKETMGDKLQTFDYSQSGNPPKMPQVDRDFALLHMSCLYWSCCILLYTTIHMAANEAHQGPSFTYFLTIPFSSPGCPNYRNERNPTLHAHRIIYTIPLSHGPYAGGYGALCSTFPLGMALRYLAVAHLFPHEGGDTQGVHKLSQELVSQPFMKAYTARFVGHLHKVDVPGQSLQDIAGWYGVELRMRRWWFGPMLDHNLGAI